jgi:hypothetical protein
MNSEIRFKVSDIINIALVVLTLSCGVAGWSFIQQYEDSKQIAAINQHLESIDKRLDNLERHLNLANKK